MSIVDLGNASASAERLMRAYHSHCVGPDLDTLFGFLEAAHSTNDRLKKAAGIEFLDIPEFLALKCLRNFFHHHDELRHEVRVVPTSGLTFQTDLLFMCLTRSELVDEAIGQVPERFWAKTRAASETTFHWYGKVVNINPCVFNFVVHAYERMVAAGIPLVGREVNDFRKSYEFETASGHPHFVDGRISTLAADIESLLLEIIA